MAISSAALQRRPEIVARVLDRPRHADSIAELRGLGCGINLMPEGDVAGVVAVNDPVRWVRGEVGDSL